MVMDGAGRADVNHERLIKGPLIQGNSPRCFNLDFKYTRFERARIIGARALQISMGAPILAVVPHGMIDPVDISMLEFSKDLIPMTVKRKKTNN